MRRTVAILFHERQPDTRRYLVSSLAEVWRAEGLEVIELFGIDTFRPADLIIVHVDLSVVPEPYLDFARRYPIALNGQVADVRKSTISQLLVTRRSEYEGPVIVKTDLNYGGYPERSLFGSPIGKLLGKLTPHRPEYRIYARIDAVPRRFFDDERFVVEKFLPEVERGRYHVRCYYFLGDRHICERFASVQPTVRGDQGTGEKIDLHPAVVEVRRRLRLDYGKIDYVIHEGQPLVIDVNKTVGNDLGRPEGVIDARLHRAAGIHSYLAE